MLLHLNESCSLASAGGMDKNQIWKKGGAAVAQVRAASQATNNEPWYCAVTLPTCDIDKTVRLQLS